MYRAIARLLLAAYVFQAVVPAQVLEEIARLPELGRHYRVHQALDPGLTVGTFLRLHYGAAFARHSGEHDHSKLPGQACHCPCAACVTATPAVLSLPPVFALAIAALPTGAPCALPEPTLLPFLYAGGIWQPPRSCAAPLT